MILFLLILCLGSCDSFLFPGYNKFLEGAYKPVSQERIVQCETDGLIPKVVSESIFSRIGPNPKFKPTGGYHIFDGDGMIHSVKFDKGCAIYQNRYIETEKLMIENKFGRAIFPKVGDLFTLWKMVKMIINSFTIPCIPRSHLSIANTNVVQHGTKKLALFEGGFPYHIEFTDKGIETVGIESFGGFINNTYTAHPKIDPDNGEIYGFSTFFNSKNISISVFGKDGLPNRKFSIEMRKPTVLHDFSITSKHIVILDTPLFLNMKRILVDRSPTKFDKNFPSRVGIIGKNDSEIEWFVIPGETFMTFHIVNSYYERGKIYITSCDLKNFSINCLFSEESKSVLHRTIVDLDSGNVSRQPLLSYNNKSLDYPIINHKWVGKKNKFVYVTELKDGLCIEILKIDLILGEIVCTTNIKTGDFTGECSFVSNGPHEDDGYIVSFITSGDISKMCIWDAHDLKEVGNVNIPCRIPTGFHSSTFKNNNVS